MEVKYLKTRLDGVQPFEIWQKKDFSGRVTRLYEGDNWGSMELTQEQIVPDNFIICDFCDVPINDFPVPVFRGSKALCPDCFKKVVVKGETYV